MQKISSFQIDHLKLPKGVFISRKQKIENIMITTVDIRMVKPYKDKVLGTAEIHAIEHLGATYLRNHNEYAESIIYFGPMGCRTGFYLVISGEWESFEILPLVTGVFEFVSNFEGEIPGASKIECGNFKDMDLKLAKKYAKSFKDEILDDIKTENLIYP
jgi:S-ribosylhomocysteine lyase